MPRYELQQLRLRADFNGCFGDILCLSHSNSCGTEAGDTVLLHEGMIVTAYDDDCDLSGERDNLIATGSVERSCESLACQGSIWCLRIDENGIRHESEQDGTRNSKS